MAGAKKYQKQGQGQQEYFDKMQPTISQATEFL
jgi:hypothetical protein